jgi:hypothetical protein
MMDSNCIIDCVIKIRQCYVHYKIQTKLLGMKRNQNPKLDDRFGVPRPSY